MFGRFMPTEGKKCDPNASKLIRKSTYKVLKTKNYGVNFSMIVRRCLFV